MTSRRSVPAVAWLVLQLIGALSWLSVGAASGPFDSSASTATTDHALSMPNDQALARADTTETTAASRLPAPLLLAQTTSTPSSTSGKTPAPAAPAMRRKVRVLEDPVEFLPPARRAHRCS